MPALVGNLKNSGLRHGLIVFCRQARTCRRFEIADTNAKRSPGILCVGAQSFLPLRSDCGLARDHLHQQLRDRIGVAIPEAARLPHSGVSPAVCRPPKLAPHVALRAVSHSTLASGQATASILEGYSWRDHPSAVPQFPSILVLSYASQPLIRLLLD